MNAALTDFQGLEYKTQVASAYEVFLTAKYIAGTGGRALPAWGSVKAAVPAIFGLLPDHPLGRLAPFKYDWRTLDDTGRKTVWNNNTRAGNRRSQTLLTSGDIRKGLLPNAAALLGAMLPDGRPSWQSLAVLILHDHDFAADDDWPDAQALLLARLAMNTAELAAITSATPLSAPLLSSTAWSFETIDEALRPAEALIVQTPADELSLPVPDQAPLSVIVDSRVERMLRLGLASYSSVLLVGPPGTGKGTLLKWVLSEIATKPERYGFEAGFAPNPLWRTPDESWSAFELIGGLAPDEGGVLAWSPGALLNALAENRWLVLDETNRGDMDKIMGPLLTWMSNQEVEVGRSAAHDGRPIRIGWSEDRDSSVVGQGDEALRYLAGRDWRLIGTYNPQDAQRVFHFGQALSRRFVIVPVPAVRPGQFAQLLEAAFPELSGDAIAAIYGLYAAHLADEATALGPAIFLGMARYLLTGLGEKPGPSGESNEQAGTSDPASDEPVEPAADEATLLSELVAEAYVMGVGRYLAGFDDRIFDALGERIVSDEAVLATGQWIWVKTQRNVLS
ncbi:MAG: AAA family ATPase [Actinomycetota bacterium]|nr:AAA family ATPase [Actinomycetota bacterium]